MQAMATNQASEWVRFDCVVVLFQYTMKTVTRGNADDAMRQGQQCSAALGIGGVIARPPTPDSAACLYIC